MRLLYLDCAMGAAGDMLTAALLELLPDPDGFVEKLNRIGIPGIVFRKERSEKCGITGTHVSVLVHGHEETEEHHVETEHHHEHHGMQDIRGIIERLDLPATVKNDAAAVYERIADAESAVHGVPVSEIHFHEVGAMDAVADIAAVCLLMAELAPDEVVASPIHVGSGTVKCAHGILPVPAPATALLLRDVPVYSDGIRGELCTPTGAALLKHFAGRFAEMPQMKINGIGYGMGTKDFDRANCVRAFLGEAPDKKETVCELSCNVDDMTAEQIGFACERLFDAGAVEVYTVPVGMKKSRPGTLIRAICRQSDREEVLKQFFQHTTTIGIRETDTKRYTLHRKIETLETPYGEIRRKVSCGYGVTRKKIEYEDLAKIAKENGISIKEAGDLLSGY